VTSLALGASRYPAALPVRNDCFRAYDDC
jgi:hypothetical protein